MTTITIDRAVVERALELLGTWAKPPARLYRVMDNLRAALAQQDEPVEPVAWRLWDEDPQGGGDWRYYDAKDFKEGIDPMKYFDGLVPLYLTPPQRKPVVSVDELANHIRVVDGNHSLGAGALAEKIVEFLIERGISKESCDAGPRAALEQQDEPVQEPVAWIQPDHLQKARIAPFLCRVEPTQRCADFVPLYLTPPQRKPQTLDEAMRLPRAMAQAYENGYKAGVAAEREACAKACEHQSHWVACAAAIRARGNT